MSCLKTETLERLVLGFLPDDGPAWTHATSCAACGRRLRVLRKEHEALAAAARSLVRRPAAHPMAFLWKPLAFAAAAHLLLLAGLVAFMQDGTDEETGDPVARTEVNVRNHQVLFQDVPALRDIYERKAPPRDDRFAMPTDEPAIFFPESKQSDHAGSDDNEDYREMKSDSTDFLPYIKGEASGLRGRAPVVVEGIGHGAGFRGRPKAERPQDGPLRAIPEGTHGMSFKDQGTHRTIQTVVQPQSTFGLDVDTASYTKVRDFLLRGVLPPPEAVRVEECVNYFRYADPRPAQGAFAVRLEAAPSPFNEGRHLFRIAIQSREPNKEARRNVNLTFVIDASGSMNMENRMGLVKRSLEVLIGQLRPEDRIGIVIYGSTGRKLLDPTPVAEKDRILSVIRGLRTEGSTNLEQGVSIGYDLAARHFDPKATNRVVICSDGVANNGVTNPVVLLRNVKEQADKGIWLSVFGFGMANYNDDLMMTLADKGNGNYAYIDDFQEARKVFTEKLSGLFDVAAADAKVQVEFNPLAVASYRQIGYEKRRLQNQDFRNDKIDAGELSAGHQVTALYEMTLQPGADGVLATVRLRYREPDTREHLETQESLGRIQVRGAVGEASPSYRLAAAVAQFAEILRGASSATLDGVLEQAQAAAADLDRPADAVEFLSMVKRAAALKK